HQGLIDQTSDQSLAHVLDDLKHIYESAEQIIRHFRVFHMQATLTDEILMDMLDGMKDKDILSDKATVLTALQEREAIGGLGIPDTGLALYHCRHDDIKELSFQITKLTEPLQIKGMDGKEMDIQTVLLLLAPAEAHDRTLE